MLLTAKDIEHLFPPSVVYEQARPQLDTSQLYPEELEQLGHAMDRRRAEYATARACAHGALTRLGFARQPVLAGESGAPIWPEGCVGSISHTRGYCAVAVARKEHIVSLGLDAEGIRALRPGVARRVCTRAELEWVQRAEPSERDARACTLFSAKEAFYKAQYPLTGRYLSFQAARVEVQEAEGRWSLESLCPSGPLRAGSRFEGSFVQRAGLVVTALVITEMQG